MNRRDRSSIWLAACFLAMLAMAGCSKSAEENTPSEPGKEAKKGGLISTTKPVTVPEGTTIAVLLDQAVSSNGSHSGEEFAATLSEPIVIEGKTVVPKDAKV